MALGDLVGLGVWIIIIKPKWDVKQGVSMPFIFVWGEGMGLH